MSKYWYSTYLFSVVCCSRSSRVQYCKSTSNSSLRAGVREAMHDEPHEARVRRVEEATPCGGSAVEARARRPRARHHVHCQTGRQGG